MTMSDQQPAPADDASAEQRGHAIRVPSLYVDAAEVHVQPFSVHLILGENDVTGATNPRMHLTMSPNFAIHLRDMLAEATRVYSAPARPAPADSPAEPASEPVGRA